LDAALDQFGQIVAAGLQDGTIDDDAAEELLTWPTGSRRTISTATSTGPPATSIAPSTSGPEATSPAEVADALRQAAAGVETVAELELRSS
jgi:hypothetical protein